MKYYCSICESEYELIGRLGKIQAEIIKDTGHTNLYCPNYSNHYQISKDKKYNSVSLKIKQKFMDLIKQGKTIGEAGKECNLDLDTSCEILLRQIKSSQYLEWNVKEKGD